MIFPTLLVVLAMFASGSCAQKREKRDECDGFFSWVLCPIFEYLDSNCEDDEDDEEDEEEPTELPGNLSTTPETTTAAETTTATEAAPAETTAGDAETTTGARRR